MLPSDTQLRKIVGGTSLDTLSHGIRLGLKFHASLALCVEGRWHVGAVIVFLVTGSCLALPEGRLDRENNL